MSQARSELLFCSDEEGDVLKENMQYAVLSSTRALVEWSKEVLQVITADRENAQGDIQTVKNHTGGTEEDCPHARKSSCRWMSTGFPNQTEAESEYGSE